MNALNKQNGSLLPKNQNIDIYEIAFNQEAEKLKAETGNIGRVSNDNEV